MELYRGIVQDKTGVIVNGATVTVYESDGSTIAAIYDKNGSSISNPFLSGHNRSEGEYEFAAPGGEYVVNVDNGAGSPDNFPVTLFSLPDAPQVYESKVTAVLAQPVSGKSIQVLGDDGGHFYGVTGAAAGTYSDNGGAYCGTVFIPTGGNGASAWVRSNEQDGVAVEYFGAAGDDITDDYQALQNALNYSAASFYPIVFSKKYRISSRLSIPSSAVTKISRKSVIKPFAGSGLVNAYLFEEGNALGRFEMPTLAGFTGVCAEIRNSLADIYIPQFNTCGTCIKVVSGGGGVTSKVLDTIVRFDAISACDIAVDVNSNYPDDVIQGLQIAGNFITNTTDAFIRTGVSSYDDGIVLDVLAVDFTSGMAGGALLDNKIAGHYVPRISMIVRSWLGGLGFDEAVPTKLVKGRFSNGLLNAVNARSFDQKHIENDEWRAGTVKFMSKVSVGSAYDLANAVGIAGFNGGVALYQSEFVVKLTLQSDVAPGATKTAYFYHMFTDSNYPQWSAVDVGGSTTQLSIVRISDQNALEENRVGIVFINNSSVIAVTGETITVKVIRQ